MYFVVDNSGCEEENTPPADSKYHVPETVSLTLVPETVSLTFAVYFKTLQGIQLISITRERMGRS